LPSEKVALKLMLPAPPTKRSCEPLTVLVKVSVPLSEAYIIAPPSWAIPLHMLFPAIFRRPPVACPFQPRLLLPLIMALMVRLPADPSISSALGVKMVKLLAAAPGAVLFARRRMPSRTLKRVVRLAAVLAPESVTRPWPYFSMVLPAVVGSFR